LNIPKYINAIKTITSREIKRNFPDTKKYIWGNSFWSRSYFLTTTGQVTLEMLKKYVDGQKEKHAAHKQD
jgi:putative transposase